MAIEKALVPFEDEDQASDEELELEIVEDEDDADVVYLGDEEDAPDIEHGANLAEYLTEADLMKISSDLIEGFQADINSREDWAKAYVNGLDLLGLKSEDRSEPWEGASGVFHPILTESVVRFQAHAMAEVFPASGPVRTKIIGKRSTEVMDQAQRVQQEMNYLITEEMPEYRDEMEMMLFRLPLAGSAFKKIYYDPLEKMPVAMFVPAEDLVVGYGASNLRSCPRYTHRMKKPSEELEELMHVGFYRDLDLPEPMAEWTDVEEQYQKQTGEKPTLDSDDRHTILEVHSNLYMEGTPFEDPDGLARPYITTIEKSSGEVLAIRRNWKEGDKRKRKCMHFSHYRYLPGMGFYGIGLIHLIGGLTKSATSILRQLIDAGTLANLPAGLKSRGLRIKGDNTPFRPGEFRDVDVPGTSIRDNIHFLPYKEPSTVLYQLLGEVTEEARRIGSIADIDIGNANQEAPVGTTLALMERSLKVMSAVQARVHASLKTELRLIAKIIHDDMPPEYSYDVGEGYSRREDFDGRVDIIPVSDPNAATMAQRIIQYQSALQLAQTSPQLYDMGRLHRQMLEVMGIQDAAEIIKLPDDIKPMDPVTENMAMLKQEPVKAFQYQDHEAHIRTHMAAMQDPKIQQIVGQSPFAGAIQAAMTAHITEHVAWEYRVQMERNLGVAMPDPEAPLPEDVEREISRLAADAAAKLLGKNQAEMAAEQAQKEAEDPLNIIQREELEIKKSKLAHDQRMEEMKFDLDQIVKLGNIEVQRERITSEEKRAGATIGAKIAGDLDRNAHAAQQQGARLGIEIAKDLKKDADKKEGEDVWGRE